MILFETTDDREPLVWGFGSTNLRLYWSVGSRLPRMTAYRVNQHPMVLRETTHRASVESAV
jgi:hypothetical protein